MLFFLREFGGLMVDGNLPLTERPTAGVCPPGDAANAACHGEPETIGPPESGVSVKAERNFDESNRPGAAQFTARGSGGMT